MPTKEYRCEDCENCWDVFCNSKHDEKECPLCFSKNIYQVITTPNVGGVRLYGEGFYKRSHKDTGDFA